MPHRRDESVVEELRTLDHEGRLRTPPAAASLPGRDEVDASSNDYLGYAREPLGPEELALLSHATLGAGASRLIRGTAPAHVTLEATAADWVRMPAALVFTSGYAANVGALQALLRPGDLLVSDRLNHASIIDGCRLSGARAVIIDHLGDVEVALSGPARRKLVVTESYFSMDGDTPDLPRLRAACDSAGAFLVVDEAHALGVFGDEGSGLCRAAGITPDLLIGTFGKAVGVQGAFVASSAELRTLLWNRARSFVFSTAMSPMVSRFIASRVERVRGDDDARERLRHNSASLRTALSRGDGCTSLATSHGPIIPVILGDNTTTVRSAHAAEAQGVLVQAIRPPTVAAGTARLRVTAKATWTNADAARVARVLLDIIAAR